MRAVLFTFVFCCWIPIIQASPIEKDTLKKKPNIVLIMSDDHGQWAMGCSGQELIRTPNLDAMANAGVHFTNAMTVAPVCSPARASFYTGRTPSQHGVHDFLSDGPGYNSNWLKGEELLSEKMQQLGYRVGLFGKWHCTTNSPEPQRGFDQWLSYVVKNGEWITQYAHSGTVHFSDNGVAKDYTGFQANFLTSAAIDFMDEKEDKPFFISLNLVEPHFPFEGLPERLVEYYRGVAQKIVPAGSASEAKVVRDFAVVGRDHNEKLAQYLAAVSLIDEQVGRMWEGLEGRDLLENTIFVYTSDHGHLTGQYGAYGKTNSTQPFNFYEENIRIPLLVMGPEEMVWPGQVRNEFVDLCDLHQFFLDVGGVDQNVKHDPKDGPGRSITPLVMGERNADWRSFQCSEHGNGRMITDGRWKLVRYYAQDPAEKPTDYWYDLSHPFGEARTSPPPREAVKTLLVKQLEEYFKTYENEAHSGRHVWSQPPCNGGEPWRTEPVPVRRFSH
ncbi:sulfatase family protein [Neolewinella persica]|uniref:sulfatase family protein n=1 Tax=Neolewinella persica TaxID=70998 RepID=UPI000694E314|nr:sulfatase-like hydrolase/transferase [Neolewinella persica]